MANNRIKAWLPAALALMITAYSCTHSSDNPTPANPASPDTTVVVPPVDTTDTTTNPADTALCFERDVLPIFVSNCAKSGCHDAVSHEDGYVFTSYATITSKKFYPGQPHETKLWKAINEDDEDDIMPPPGNTPLTDQQKARILQWILMGAPNSTGCSTGGGGCDTTNVTYAGTIQPLMTNYCTGCHSGAAPSGGINLSSHAGVATVALNGQLYGSINHAAGYVAMPQGGAKLSDCNIAKVRTWINAGAPNN